MRLFLLLILFLPLSPRAQEVQVRFGSYVDGETANFTKIRYTKRVYVSSIKDRLNIFYISGGTIQVDGIGQAGNILDGGRLNEDARKMVEQCQGKEIKIVVNYEDTNEVNRRASAVIKVE